MLFYSTIHPKTLQLLKDLQSIPKLNEFLLVGGTSLALQIGHRISIDLDLFATAKIETDSILELLSDFNNITITNQTNAILNLYIGEIKVDFVFYKYGFLESPILVDDIKLATLSDIAAMKIAAITGRGSKKDFIDLYFLLKSFSLPQIFNFYQKKYPDSSDFLAFRSLTYFEDAELEPMPKMIEPISWKEVKNKIILEVKTHFP